MPWEPLQTVTYPILTKPSLRNGRLEEPDGWRPTRNGMAAVTLLSAERLLESWGIHRGSKTPGIPEGINLLRYAYEVRDDLALSRARDLIGRDFLPGSNLEGITHTELFEKRWGLAKWIFAHAMNNYLEGVRLVFWYPNRSSDSLAHPAFFCPTDRAAVYAASFSRLVKVCPKCLISFVPEADNVEYCKPSHGVAYRTARSRYFLKLAGDLIVANRELPLEALMRVLMENGIKREKKWVVGARKRLLRSPKTKPVAGSQRVNNA